MVDGRCRRGGGRAASAVLVRPTAMGKQKQAAGKRWVPPEARSEKRSLSGVGKGQRERSLFAQLGFALRS